MNRAALFSVLLFLSCLPFFFTVASSQTQACSSYTFSGNRAYTDCVDLPVLSSFLHWNYSHYTGSVDIAFRKTGTSNSRWVSWAINPNGRGMKGCQALVAYFDSAGAIRAYTSPITSYDTTMPEGVLSFGTSNISATFASGEWTIFAKLQLGSGMTTVNQVWQEGPMNSGNPGTHSTSGPNGRSRATLNFANATVPLGSGGGGSASTSKNVHGMLNAVSWGILMPMGVIFARYVKVFKGADPAWFYMHVTCQTSAYILGVSGWATGLRLGDEGGETGYHGAVGAILFIGGTLQVFALLLRPKKDHKYRFFWNIYHHSIGYTTIILSIVNVFKGLDLLHPSQVWKTTYTVIIIVLGSLALLLEIVTWFIVIKRRRSQRRQPKYPPSNGGAVGYINGQSHYGV
ncbi:hypothetical protein SAY86_027377 [Trapa natans]|uniref:Cytochrome b561 and DOMON domain-containing protein n=1 Tax=Trapa natans TaxID=22666 RepID=A0AAN7KMA1_TRANT|nr:hypothetical protein SAY86_027377 [Trapa natans]